MPDETNKENDLGSRPKKRQPLLQKNQKKQT